MSTMTRNSTTEQHSVNVPLDVPWPTGKRGCPDMPHSSDQRKHEVELRGIEPLTSCLQSRCSSQLSYSPKTASLPWTRANNR